MTPRDEMCRLSPLPPLCRPVSTHLQNCGLLEKLLQLSAKNCHDINGKAPNQLNAPDTGERSPCGGAEGAIPREIPVIARSGETMTLRVLLADDYRLFRESVRSLLEQDSLITVVGDAATGREALELARRDRPHVVLMEVMMPEMSGIDATRIIKRELPDVMVLGFSMRQETTYVVEMLKAGASGYLLKKLATPSELGQAIRVAAEGEIYFGQRIPHILVKQYFWRLAEEAAAGAPVLGAKERQLLGLIAAGESCKEISFSLGVSVRTVEARRARIMKKLNLRSVAELIKYALREGLASM